MTAKVLISPQATQLFQGSAAYLYPSLVRLQSDNDLLDAANALKSKNHFAYYAVIHPDDANAECYTIRFPMNVLNNGEYWLQRDSISAQYRS